MTQTGKMNLSSTNIEVQDKELKTFSLGGGVLLSALAAFLLQRKSGNFVRACKFRRNIPSYSSR